MQYFNLANSNSEYFKITGSAFNPNITAMYLAMSLPAALYIYRNKPFKVPQAIYVIPFVLIGLAIVTLQCRTAVIAIVIAMFIVTAISLYQKTRLKYLLLAGILLCGLLAPVGKYFYRMKKDSADGRLLVWKTSFKLIKEKPLNGYGIGLFEKEYNLKQADYIKTNELTQQESKTASYVNMAYN
ncbi:O-antigen ligase domain-containing protein, partial [Pseudoxanthomonas sp. SGD-10]